MLARQLGRCFHEEVRSLGGSLAATRCRAQTPAKGRGGPVRKAGGPAFRCLRQREELAYSACSAASTGGNSANHSLKTVNASPGGDTLAVVPFVVEFATILRDSNHFRQSWNRRDDSSSI